MKRSINERATGSTKFLVEPVVFLFKLACSISLGDAIEYDEYHQS